jgi:hypothetical protein
VQVVDGCLHRTERGRGLDPGEDHDVDRHHAYGSAGGCQCRLRLDVRAVLDHPPSEGQRALGDVLAGRAVARLDGEGRDRVGELPDAGTWSTGCPKPGSR